MSAFRRVIGLMSGTSADGVDAALVEVGRSESGVRLVAFTGLPYPRELRREILEVSEARSGNAGDICRLNVILGEWFARSAFKVCRKAGVAMSGVDLIGSHGQTVHHLPDAYHGFGVTTRSSLQIADPSVIAERTGVTTVADFRARDMAAGGQGAPLVPVVDYLLFRSVSEGRVLLNIGGISNVTVLPAGCGTEDVLAFDTGPGNMLMDGLMGRPYRRTPGLRREWLVRRSGKCIRFAAGGIDAPPLSERGAAQVDRTGGVRRNAGSGRPGLAWTLAR